MLKYFIQLLVLLVSVLIFTADPIWAASPGTRWGADYFPNVPLVTQDGKTVHFYDDMLKDKVVLINFIYTHCKDACPTETARLLQVKQLLGDRVGRDVFMYSISIDPDHDTPAELKAYTTMFKIGPGWEFLTGKKDDIILIRKKLGMYREDLDGQKLSEHNTSLIVGNATTGQWMKRSPFDNPRVLARVVGDQLHNFMVPKTGQASYADAARIKDFSRGEYLFRTRCNACHSLGKEDGLGPGLLGVTKRRERNWLTRWLKEPDKVLAEKDPVAVAMFAQYKNLPMPNLKLNDVDVNSLLDYLEKEYRRVEKSSTVTVTR